MSLFRLASVEIEQLEPGARVALVEAARFAIAAGVVLSLREWADLSPAEQAAWLTARGVTAATPPASADPGDELTPEELEAQHQRAILRDVARSVAHGEGG